MKKKELKAKLDRTEFREAVMQIELAHACRSIEKLRGDLVALQLELDTKADDLEALQQAACAEVAELKENLEQAQSSAHRYYKLYTVLQSDVDKRRMAEEEQAAWLEQEMARLKDEGF